MKEILLTQGYVAMVDDEDYEKLSQYTWTPKKDNNVVYARRSLRIDGKHKEGFMHRDIMGIPDKGYVIDHVDGNGLNNQKNNLRIITHKQNMQNLHINKTSIYPGVNWSAKRRKWEARCKDRGVRRYLGGYEKEIDAFRAYYDFILSIGQEILDFPYPAKCASGDTIYLIIGPSGAGKTTLAQYLKVFGVPELISHTTRQPRPGEIDGHTYYFVTQEQFDSIEMIESTVYNDNSYGTSKAEVERVLSSSGSAFAIVDKTGVEQFKAIYGDSVKVIYIYVPVKLAAERMRARGDSEDAIADRIRHAFRSGEFDNLGIADYCIVNKDLGVSLRQLKAIVGGE